MDNLIAKINDKISQITENINENNFHQLESNGKIYHVINNKYTIIENQVTRMDYIHNDIKFPKELWKVGYVNLSYEDAKEIRDMFKDMYDMMLYPSIK